MICADNVAARRDEAAESFGFAAATDDWRRGDRPRRGRRRRRHRAEHAPRGAVRGGRRGRQARVLREARRRHARADRAHRGRGPGGRASSPVSGTTTAGRRWCCTPASSWRPTGSGSSPTTAAGSSRCTAAIRWACCRGGSWRPRAATACRATSSATPSTWPRSSSVRSPRWSGPRRRSSASGRSRSPARRATTPSAGPAIPTGEVTNEDYAAALVVFANGVRGTVRELAVDRRPGEPDGLRALRHEGRGQLEPRAAQRAAGLPGRRRRAGAARLHDGVRRRPLPVPRRTSCRATPTASASRTWSPSRTTSS